MLHDAPRRITAKKLLRFTGQQQECKEISTILTRHDRAVARLEACNLKYDVATGRIVPAKLKGTA